MTRAHKRDVDKSALRESWQKQAADLGFDAGKLVVNAREKSLAGNGMGRASHIGSAAGTHPAERQMDLFDPIPSAEPLRGADPLQGAGSLRGAETVSAAPSCRTRFCRAQSCRTQSRRLQA